MYRITIPLQNTIHELIVAEKFKLNLRNVQLYNLLNYLMLLLYQYFAHQIWKCIHLLIPHLEWICVFSARKCLWTAVHFNLDSFSPQKIKHCRRRESVWISSCAFIASNSCLRTSRPSFLDPIWDGEMRSRAVIASVVKAAFNLRFMTLLNRN